MGTCGAEYAMHGYNHCAARRRVAPSPFRLVTTTERDHLTSRPSLVNERSTLKSSETDVMSYPFAGSKTALAGHSNSHGRHSIDDHFCDYPRNMYMRLS